MSVSTDAQILFSRVRGLRLRLIRLRYRKKLMIKM